MLVKKVLFYVIFSISSCFAAVEKEPFQKIDPPKRNLLDRQKALKENGCLERIRSILAANAQYFPVDKEPKYPSKPDLKNVYNIGNRERWPADQNNSLLYRAIDEKHYHNVVYLLESYPTPDITNYADKTALHEICYMKYELRDYSFEFIAASYALRYEIIQALIILGFDVNILDCHGQGPLFYACCSAMELKETDIYYATLELLLQAGANPNITDKYGAGPLYLIIQSDECTEATILKLVTLLMEYGATPQRVCHGNLTLYNYVEEKILKAKKRNDHTSLRLYDAIQKLFYTVKAVKAKKL